MGASLREVTGGPLFRLVNTAFFLGCSTWALCTTSANASPWARPDGELLTISQTSYFSNRQSFQNEDNEVVQQRFQRIASEIYLEYGATASLTVGAKAVYGTAWLTRGNEVETAAGFNEIGGFAQYQFLQSDRSAASIRLGAFAPSNLNNGVREGLQNDGVDADIAVLYGRNLSAPPFKTFASADIGYRKRFGDAADQIRIQTTLGAEPGQRWLILVQSFTELSLRNETSGGADFDIVKLQPSLVRHLGDPETGRWSLQAGYTEELAGRKLALGRAVFVSLWRRF